MNKLQEKAQSSKLNIIKQKKDKIVSVVHKESLKVRSFTLDEASSIRLQELLEKVNGLSQRRVNASHLIRALIYLGKKSKDNELLKVLKEVAF